MALRVSSANIGRRNVKICLKLYAMSLTGDFCKLSSAGGGGGVFVVTRAFAMDSYKFYIVVKIDCAEETHFDER